jgi:hypothetical protein
MFVRATMLTGYAVHEKGRGDDRDVAKGIEREQIAVAGDEQISMRSRLGRPI